MWGTWEVEVIKKAETVLTHITIYICFVNKCLQCNVTVIKQEPYGAIEHREKKLSKNLSSKGILKDGVSDVRDKQELAE